MTRCQRRWPVGLIGMLILVLSGVPAGASEPYDVLAGSVWTMTRFPYQAEDLTWNHCIHGKKRKALRHCVPDRTLLRPTPYTLRFAKSEPVVTVEDGRQKTRYHVLLEDSGAMYFLDHRGRRSGPYFEKLLGLEKNFKPMIVSAEGIQADNTGLQAYYKKDGDRRIRYKVGYTYTAMYAWGFERRR